MLLSNIDTICRRWLLEQSLPIHYYAEALFHASTAVRELSFDTLQIVNCANLPVGDYAEVNLPEDFADDISVCIPIGNTLNKLPKQDWISPIRIHSTTTGQFVPNTSNVALVDVADNQNFWGFPGSWVYFWNIDSYGSPTGRFFGAAGGTQQGYKVIKERRQIQLTDNFIGSNVVLLYISDGQRADNATQIETLAISCIQSYIDWKRSPNAAMKDSYEAATFYNEKRLLRARKDDLDIATIKNIIRNNYVATIKN